MIRILFAAIAPFLLAGCWLAPGKFTSKLTVLKDGSFGYSYEGEIQMLGLSKLAELDSQANDTFKPKECIDEESWEPRVCTEEEVAEQRAQWEADTEARRAKREQQAEQMKQVMGGIDPTSPEAAEEFVELLSRQKGWKRVSHRGDGIFDVDFEINGMLSHDFLFPVIEGMPLGNTFVTAVLRKDGQVRINAPGFAAQGGGDPFSGIMGGPMGKAMLATKLAGDDKQDEAPLFVELDGTFTVVTDGEILANNTDEGPGLEGSLRVLSWAISPRSEQAPMALISLL